MQEWSSPALILNARPYGEKGAVVSFLTQNHGLKRSFAYGVFSSKKRALWQKGNYVQLTWKSRTGHDLGRAEIELLSTSCALLYDRPLALAMVSSFSALLDLSLAEGEAMPELFHESLAFLKMLPLFPDDFLLEKYIKWESFLLTYVGYGLSLAACVLSGKTENLRYVSPKTGCAVAEEEGKEWEERLLRLPKFMGGSWAEAEKVSLEWGLKLTGHFLEKLFIEMRNSDLPQERKFLLKMCEEKITAKLEGKN